MFILFDVFLLRFQEHHFHFLQIWPVKCFKAACILLSLSFISKALEAREIRRVATNRLVIAFSVSHQSGPLASEGTYVRIDLLKISRISSSTSYCLCAPVLSLKGQFFCGSARMLNDLKYECVFLLVVIHKILCPSELSCKMCSVLHPLIKFSFVFLSDFLLVYTKTVKKLYNA